MKSWMPELVCIIVLLYPQLVRGDQEPLATKRDCAWKGIKLGSAILDIGGTYRLRGEVQDETNIRTYGTGTKKTTSFPGCDSISICSCPMPFDFIPKSKMPRPWGFPFQIRTFPPATTLTMIRSTSTRPISNTGRLRGRP